MDSDDTIPAECGRQLRAGRREAEPVLLGYVMQVHCPGGGTDGPGCDMTAVDHVKLIRNRPDLRFEGRIHEQILPAIRRDDGVQELWLMLIKRLPDLCFDPSRGDIRDWICTAAENRLVDHERSRRSHATEYLREVVLDALADLRGQVSPRDYEAFTLRWVEGLSVREIVCRLGMTDGQIWSSHHRTRRKLRLLLVQRPQARSRSFCNHGRPDPRPP